MTPAERERLGESNASRQDEGFPLLSLWGHLCLLFALAWAVLTWLLGLVSGSS